MNERYGNMATDILHMEPTRAYEYLYKAIKKIQEDRMFQRWINGYQTVKYDEFKENAGYIEPVNILEQAREKEKPVAESEEIQTLKKVEGILGKEKKWKSSSYSAQSS